MKKSDLKFGDIIITKYGYIYVLVYVDGGEGIRFVRSNGNYLLPAMFDTELHCKGNRDLDIVKVVRPLPKDRIIAASQRHIIKYYDFFGAVRRGTELNSYIIDLSVYNDPWRTMKVDSSMSSLFNI